MRVLRSVGLFLFAFTALFAAEYRYSYLPKYLYPSQIFPVTVAYEADSNVSTPPLFRFEPPATALKLLLEEPLRTHNGNERFATFYFQAPQRIGKILLPPLHISDASGEDTLPSAEIAMRPLPPKKEATPFCGVLASKMHIKHAQVSNYDADKHLVTLLLEANEANLEAMHIEGSIDEGVENLQREGAKVRAEYYTVVPKNTNTLRFLYFNTITERYEALQAKTELQNASVTTQSDLNPNVDAFLRLKRYALIALALFFLLLFLWKREWFFLLLFLADIAILASFYMPQGKICVKQGAPLYLLPTQNATIGRYIDKQRTLPLLGRRKEYNKVVLEGKIYGWIKDEDVCGD